ncbi:MAG: hypothetical protein F6K54_17800 [Okeania sp. SIO3B5]|uniref:hypothetical protein n=1 Tax=Okeania sp. SIO3B5 TaxID=2607811 RepID=UPI0013FEEB3E|nr:hypothetical protein [Okeania sp. SIO3B5]NEO54771.1 hypothetical protein [Okeania sp. SIO3B5]
MRLQSLNVTKAIGKLPHRYLIPSCVDPLFQAIDPSSNLEFRSGFYLLTGLMQKTKT